MNRWGSGRHRAEMLAAMLVAMVVLGRAVRGAVTGDDLPMFELPLGHVAILPLMCLAMLCRRSECGGHAHG
jgi:hypothetical protein